MPEQTLPGFDREIWMSAGALLQKHGAKAILLAGETAARLEEAGDEQGSITWRRILRAAAALNAIPTGRAN